MNEIDFVSDEITFLRRNKIYIFCSKILLQTAAKSHKALNKLWLNKLVCYISGKHFEHSRACVRHMVNTVAHFT